MVKEKKRPHKMNEKRDRDIKIPRSEKIREWITWNRKERGEENGRVK